MDSLTDEDTINLFAEASGLVGDVEVENGSKDLKWDQHIDSLWAELLKNLLQRDQSNRLMMMTNRLPALSQGWG